jgi:hypothetical protein
MPPPRVLSVMAILGQLTYGKRLIRVISLSRHSLAVPSLASFVQYPRNHLLHRGPILPPRSVLDAI